MYLVCTREPLTSNSLLFHNSADSSAVMNALQHSNLYPDRLLAEPQVRAASNIRADGEAQ
jgi:hypothetical protein